MRKSCTVKLGGRKEKNEKTHLPPPSPSSRKSWLQMAPPPPYASRGKLGGYFPVHWIFNVLPLVLHFCFVFTGERNTPPVRESSSVVCISRRGVNPLFPFLCPGLIILMKKSNRSLGPAKDIYRKLIGTWKTLLHGIFRSRKDYPRRMDYFVPTFPVSD